MAGLVPFNRKKNDLMNIGFDDFHSMLDDFFADAWPTRRSLQSDTFKVDVQEEDKEYIVQAELPGVKKEEINLSLEDGRLRIGVQRDEQKEEKEKNYIHKERRYCSMERNIFLQEADSEGISAKLEDGVLKIHIPKTEHVDTSKKIEIE
ncbi:Hsp20/alpha crystallin family protein [Proteiniclasticum sp. SCR006]|uniref:Hsp20/alpha crystallin family protein n=1 Tax=Proteiniclasticum aestuarii TaxID=2817862 RepID=A0A939HDB8_9CLOT|nr:Hsp20/alpha crystallin family protein [Proteiniclasticum aestuarii]MBO1265193.1 Hsp20/alpha crystallin family protein [Proteiniclasticum aestuarii]